MKYVVPVAALILVVGFGFWLGRLPDPNSLEGEWTGKVNKELMSPLLDMYPAGHKLSYVSSSLRFDRSGKFVDTALFTDAHGKQVADSVIGTYLTHGDTLFETYTGYTHSESSSHNASSLTGSMVTRYKIDGDRLLLLGQNTDQASMIYERVR